MSNEKGMSFIDSILTLAAIVIFISFFPIITHMRHSLYLKKCHLHASEVALEGVTIAMENGKNNGEKTIDGVHYQWTFDGEAICVHFHVFDEERMKCVNREGEYSIIQKDTH